MYMNVYTYLWMLFADIRQEVMDEFADQALGVVYPGNELWDDLQPGVYFYGANTITQGLVHIRQVSIVKP